MRAVATSGMREKKQSVSVRQRNGKRSHQLAAGKRTESDREQRQGRAHDEQSKRIDERKEKEMIQRNTLSKKRSKHRLTQCENVFIREHECEGEKKRRKRAASARAKERSIERLAQCENDFISEEGKCEMKSRKRTASIRAKERSIERLTQCDNVFISEESENEMNEETE